LKNYKADFPCIVCGWRVGGMVTFHHVKTRGSGGNDEEHNLMPLCAWHHVETHNIGTVSFSKKYPNVNNWLISNGWSLEAGKWRHF
jgi:predicted restriction endonuclease